MEVEKAKFKRQQEALVRSYIWWFVGALIAGTPFLASLISILLFTPLAALFVATAIIPVVFLIVFQKYFVDGNAVHLKQANNWLSNTTVLYTILILTMLAGSVIGFVIYSKIVGSFLIRF
ncbi:hypothetical protein PQU92_15690 [Asticcacaulis sp. BYS171W]|uniref:Uncharacterized protein n=1 Tax=Asticcacaulis aquaticus TaxID=2984212 RepID=A0ABT5HXQ9_9CAUL|nr:hypothetical protein [Asticcacaulis aquaticus]MDC7684727.1 hypothetical protein [Asticcacaulis aquaticus]